MSTASTSSSSKKHKVVIVGSGNWGSAIARIAGQNTQRHSDTFQREVQMYVFEEDYNGKPLSQVINETHENPKYLPGCKLPDNVIANPNPVDAVKDATLLVFVLPHQFIRSVCKQ